MKKEQTIIKFDNIKDLLYHSTNTYADNIAFTTKIKKGKEVEYITHTYTNLLEDINCFGTSLYKLGLQDKRSFLLISYALPQHESCYLQKRFALP